MIVPYNLLYNRRHWLYTLLNSIILYLFCNTSTIYAYNESNIRAFDKCWALPKYLQSSLLNAFNLFETVFWRKSRVICSTDDELQVIESMVQCQRHCWSHRQHWWQSKGLCNRCLMCLKPNRVTVRERIHKFYTNVMLWVRVDVREDVVKLLGRYAMLSGSTYSTRRTLHTCWKNDEKSWR